VVARGRERLATALGVLRDSGGTTLCGVLYSKLGKYAEPATERGRANSQESIAWLADKAAASGVTLALEFCNRYETNIINTTQETLDFIAAVDRPNVMAHLDTYHMNIEEHSFTEAVRAAAAAGRLGYVHVGESHRGALGTGTIPWPEFFAALTEVGYDGILTFESFSSEVVHRTLSNDLAIWRNLWTDNKALAREARASTKAALAEAAAGRCRAAGSRSDRPARPRGCGRPAGLPRARRRQVQAHVLGAAQQRPQLGQPAGEHAARPGLHQRVAQRRRLHRAG